MTNRTLMNRMLLTVVSGLCLCGAVQGGPAGETDAKTVTERHARGSGLCAVISTAKEIPAPFIAALARSGMVVHVLTTSDEARSRLVAALGKSSDGDAVMIERVASLGRLPYYDNFVNLLVVDDARTIGKKGVSRSELERVVTPDGDLAIRKGGAWEFVRKAWPVGMDEWTHPNYDATGNRRSTDKFFKPPYGFKWIDGIGIPMSGAASCQGWVVVDGKLIAVNAVEPENLAPARDKSGPVPFYLVARDAFNGLLLWKVQLDAPQARWALSWRAVMPWRNATPIAANKKVVFAVKNGVLAGFDVATGTQAFVCANRFTPWAIRLSGSTVVTAGTAPAPQPSLNERGRPIGPSPLPSQGAVEAFDATTGAQKWSAAIVANEIQASSKVLYALVHPETETADSVLAFDLNTGTMLFAVSGAQLGAQTVRLLSAGEGYELLNCDSSIVALSATDGKVLWRVDDVESFWGVVMDGMVWIDGAGYDVMTGKKLKALAQMPIAEHLRPVTNGNDFGCTPYNMVGNMVLALRHHRVNILNDESMGYYLFTGARAGCVEGMTPAAGMAFTAPRDCICTATHPYGFIAMAPVGSDPTPAEMTALRPVERGEAFGTLASDSQPVGEWSTYRGNPERSTATTTPIPYHFRQRWSVKLTPEPKHGRIDDSYVARTLARVSPPVVGGGNVFVALAERGEVVALDAKSGAEKWRYRAGSRIETPPTIYRNACFFGCNDGYVYAVTAAGGKTMWRTRLAPREMRLMEHGVVQSLWPVYGSVLAHKGLLYAAAGLSSEANGGTALFALDPATGEQKWVRQINVAMQRKNDVVCVTDGMVTWRGVPFDPATGACDLDSARVKLSGTPTAMWDNSVLETFAERKMGAVYTVDNRGGWLLGWNKRYIVSDSLVSRRRNDPLKTTDSIARLSGGKPTALVMGPNVAVAGYGGPAVKQPRITLFTYDNPTTLDIKLNSGVTHNGIAVVSDGLVLTLDDGSVTMLEGTPATQVASDGVVFRVNCGGKAFTDTKGNAWLADQEFKPGSWGAVGGGMVDRRQFIGGLDLSVTRGRFPPEIAEMNYTERYGMDAYRFSLPNGYYAVTLHFAETYYYGVDAPYPNSDQSATVRRFNVSLNGIEVLHRFSPYREAGNKGFAPVARRFEAEVVNGELTIGFSAYEAGQLLNGIEIIGLPGLSRDNADAGPVRALPKG